MHLLSDRMLSNTVIEDWEYTLEQTVETGIGNRSKENFIGLFKSFKEPIKLPEGQTHENTVMAWSSYAGMTEDDLGAIYDYLQTIKPVSHVVEKYPSK